VLRRDPDFHLFPRSEFRPPSVLAPILSGHPLFPRILTTLRRGANCPLELLSEVERLLDLEEALEYGNHKSAQQDGEIILASLR
jgi:hypothetical protein